MGFLPTVAYIYAVGSLLSLAVVVYFELRRKPFARRVAASARFKFDPFATSVPETQKMSRQKLTQACRSSAKFQLAQYSLGRRLLETNPRETQR